MLADLLRSSMIFVTFRYSCRFKLSNFSKFLPNKQSFSTNLVTNIRQKFVGFQFWEYLYSLLHPLSLGQVFVAVKKWESCIYFQRKLHLCAGSCVYAHIWLRKTWHNLFSFAWTWPKAKIFRSSTSNWVRALSYLAGVVKLLACKLMRRS